MSYEEYVINANMAFSGGYYYESLKYAKQAISLNQKEADAYLCAGKASISLGKNEEAADYFQKAVDIDKTNGNSYFLLGYAQVLAGNTAAAIRNLTRSLENNCDQSLKGQVYKMMSMINMDQGDYKNALANLVQAEENAGLDYEILQQKAACFANLKDFHQTIFTLNQMKLLQPNDYSTYSLAFHIFMELEIYDEALAELKRAEKYAELNIVYYNDCIAYTLLHNPADDTKDNMKDKWRKAISAINEALLKGEPNAEQVYELYLRAAQLYLSLGIPDKALSILEAAADPVSSFNQGFSVLIDEVQENMESDLSLSEVTADDDEMQMQRKWDNGEFDEIREAVNEALLETAFGDSEEIMDTVEEYLSPMDHIPASEAVEKKYSLTEEFKVEPLQHDMRNSLYLTVYEQLEDYDAMLQKARELQASNILANQYSGIYYELRAGKYKEADNWQRKYRDRINFWTKRMLENPTDYISAGYRIRCYIDLEDFENAEQLCSCLPVDVKRPLMDEIRKKKKQGGGEIGDSTE